MPEQTCLPAYILNGYPTNAKCCLGPNQLFSYKLLNALIHFFYPFKMQHDSLILS